MENTHLLVDGDGGDRDDSGDGNRPHDAVLDEADAVATEAITAARKRMIELD